ncbi:MAG: type VI secretion system tube protein Hcp [Lysobacteraceae bacterium]
MVRFAALPRGEVGCDPVTVDRRLFGKTKLAQAFSSALQIRRMGKHSDSARMGGDFKMPLWQPSCWDGAPRRVSRILPDEAIMSNISNNSQPSSINDLLDLDQLVLSEDMDMLLEVKPKGGGTPLKGEGRPAAGLGSPSLILGFRWGQSRHAGETAWKDSASLGARMVSDLYIVKEVDLATAGLAGICGTNKGVEKATLVCLKAGDGQKEYLRIEVSDGGLRNHNVFTSGRHNRVLESFQITFNTLTITCLPQTGKGSMGGATQFQLVIPTA